MTIWHWLISRVAGAFERRNRMRDFELELSVKTGTSSWLAHLWGNGGRVVGK
jgi:hypothetical protein